MPRVTLLDRHAVVAGRDVAVAVVHRHDLRLVAGRVVLDPVHFHRELAGRHRLRQLVADVRLVAVDGRAAARRERHAADDLTDRGASRQRIVELAGHVVGGDARAERRSGRPRAVDGALAGAGAPVEARRRLQVGGHVERGVVRTFGDARLGGHEPVVARHVRRTGRLEVRVVRDLELVGARSCLIGRRLADDAASDAAWTTASSSAGESTVGAVSTGLAGGGGGVGAGVGCVGGGSSPQAAVAMAAESARAPARYR